MALQVDEGGGSALLDYLVDPHVFTFVDGHIERPAGPGLGIELDEAAVRAAAADGRRRRRDRSCGEGARSGA